MQTQIQNVLMKKGASLWRTGSMWTFFCFVCLKREYMQPQMQIEEQDFLCIFSPSVSHHITFWFHPLLCHYGITMWNMSLAFFVAFIFPINNLGKIEGGRGYKVNFRADLICCLVTWFGWSAGVWCKNQEEACSDSRKPVVALPMKHTVYNSLSLNCIIFRVEIEALCIHCYTVLVCSINNSLSRHFPTLTYFIQPRCWFHHKVKYKLSNFFYIYYLPEKIFHL